MSKNRNLRFTLEDQKGIDKMSVIEKKQVEEVLAQIRQSLQMDGGDIELVKIEGDEIFVKFKGACAGCPMAQMTLEGLVAQAISEKIPGVKKVKSVN